MRAMYFLARSASAISELRSMVALKCLRAGTNDMICLAPKPGAEKFHSACYHKAMEPFMARGRELRGQGVKVLSENEAVDAQGNRAHTGQSDEYTASFARNFSRSRAAAVFCCSCEISRLLMERPTATTTSSSTPAATIDGCRRDHFRTRSTSDGRRARIG